MVQYTPMFKPGEAVTFTASADVIGGRVVEVTGDRTVAHAGAGSTKVAGVAGFDAKAGESVTVFSGGIQRPTASGAIAAGDAVAAAANGHVATSADGTGRIGVALAAAADGETAQIKLER